MGLTADDVFDAAGALLNDPDKVTFTDAVQLPFLQISWRELQNFLLANGITDVDEFTTVALTITAQTQQWTSTPTDLLLPIKLWERAVGGSDQDWVEMDEQIPDPADPMETELEIWYFKEGDIWFRGATTNRQVIVRYQRELGAITGQASVIKVRGSLSFLSFRTAGIIARARGNKSRANDLDADAKMHLDNIISTKVKDEQGMPARPRRYGFTRRANRSRRLI